MSVHCPNQTTLYLTPQLRKETRKHKSELGRASEICILSKVTDAQFATASKATSDGPTLLKCAFIVVAPVMSLKIRGVTDRSVDLEWEGSVVLTDFLVTYTPSSAGGRQRASGLLLQKGALIHTSRFFFYPSLCQGSR